MKGTEKPFPEHWPQPAPLAHTSFALATESVVEVDGGPDPAGTHTSCCHHLPSHTTTHNHPARQPRLDLYKSSNAALTAGLERGPGTLEQW